ncbi:MAG: gliding motility-associated C-terminal domain-containing protein, partial [Flavobacterium sp.]
GYAGVPSPSVSVCNDNTSFNLFQVFNGTFLSPQSNGVWHDDTNNVYVKSSISVKDLLGTFQYTYTIPAIGSCPAKSSTVEITMFRAPKPGTPIPLLLCGTDDLSAYTNLDLNDLLSGEDSGGSWWPDFRLSSPTDHYVNLQELFDTYGETTHHFVYKVLSDNSICTDKSANLDIRLEKKLDFTQAKVVVSSDICEPEITAAKYTVTITQGIQAIPNGEYQVSFNVSGPNGGNETIKAMFVNGELSFPIKSSYFLTVGAFTVTINNIVATTSQKACVNIINNLSDVLNIYPKPILDGAVLSANAICQNKSALIQISEASGLADGTYNILYNISGTNTASGQMATITAIGGNANFTIPSNLNSNSGTSVITVTAITNSVTPYCTNTANLKGSLIINKLPDTTNLKVEVLDDCFNKPFSVSVSGLGTLTDVTISYILSGSNSATAQTVTLAAVSGKANFIIPPILLPNTGSVTISITNLVNNDTTCDVNLTVSDTFLINPIPVAPIASDQSFCKVDGATIANLLPNGTQYKWYNSGTLTAALSNTYVLRSENYWVTETSAAGCTSPSTMITVTINDSPAPVLDQDGQNFCGLENPTILDLSNKTNVPSTVVWYDALNNGNLLTSTTPLTDNTTYYGFDFSTSTNCISDDNTEVTVSLTHCDDSEYETFFVPDGFSPNGDNVNDTFTILKIDFLYPDYTIEIFNRYGNILFKGNKNKPDWDGRNSGESGFGGEIVPNGVYFYVIHFNKDNKPAKQGRLYLNR